MYAPTITTGMIVCVWGLILGCAALCLVKFVWTIKQECPFVFMRILITKGLMRSIRVFISIILVGLGCFCVFVCFRLGIMMIPNGGT